MATTIIKSSTSNNQAVVDENGHLMVAGTLSPAPGAATSANQETEIALLTTIADNTSSTGGMGFSALSPGYPTQISVGTTSAVLLPGNTLRRYAHIFNNTQNPIFIQYSSSAALNHGIKINPGNYFTLSGADLWLGDVTAIALIPGQMIDVLEGI